MADVQILVLDRFQKLYGDPKRSDMEAFFEEYEIALMGWNEDVLRRAVDIVVREHEYPSWPMPGAVHKACERVAPTRQVTPNYPDPERVHLTDQQHAAMDEAYAKTRAVLQKTADGLELGKRPLPDTSRPAFEKMQRESKNPTLHMTPEGLTALSKRITGERE